MRSLFLLCTLLLMGCANTEPKDINVLYNIEFGIISNPEELPLTIDKKTNIIPWKNGVHEPRYGAHVTKDTDNKFILHYQVYAFNPESKEKKLIENSEYWRVTGGLSPLKGGILQPDFVGGVKYGAYFFAIFVDQMKEPIKVIPFQIVPYND